MSDRNLSDDGAIATDMLASVLKSQYHAAIVTLRQAVEQCPDSLWADGSYVNPSWRIAYHTLYFTHLYIQPEAAAFRPWEHHQTNIQYLDDLPAPPDIEELVELPHRPPQTGKPYSRAQILNYCRISERMIDEAVDALDLRSSESGFSWYRISKLEHQIVAIRHIQHHAAQLSERLRTSSGIGIDWVSVPGRKPGGEE